jgi:hypothetical protein
MMATRMGREAAQEELVRRASKAGRNSSSESLVSSSPESSFFRCFHPVGQI